MRKPWVLKFEAEGEVKLEAFPSKKAAVESAKVSAANNPAYIALVYRRATMEAVMVVEGGDTPRVQNVRRMLLDDGRKHAEHSFARLVETSLSAMDITAEQAARIRQVIVRSWAQALQRGEEVEIPIGILRVTAAPKQIRRIRKLAGSWKFQVLHRRPKKIKLEQNTQIVLPLLAVTPKPSRRRRPDPPPKAPSLAEEYRHPLRPR
jgi:autonomous glycyl radical cofactor GrcA